MTTSKMACKNRFYLGTDGLDAAAACKNVIICISLQAKRPSPDWR
jgi:hypothetical protein